MNAKLALLLAASIAAGCSRGVAAIPAGDAETSSARAARPSFVQNNDIPPRLQWLANDGYCGETAFVSAGLYYGQYASQYAVRALASPGVPQSRARSQLLLGANDTRAATAMHLAFEAWPGGNDPSTDAFAAWIKRNVVRGYPVVIGVYENRALLGSTPPDAQYDHIVPVVGVASNLPPGDPRYNANDSITFSDNGLHGFLPKPGHTRPLSTYLNVYAAGAFQRTRKAALAPGAPWYSLPENTPHKGPGNFGIALTGVIDGDRETLPVRIVTNVPWEYPYMRNGSNLAPKPERLQLAITVSGLRPGVAYNLYRFDDFAAVPNSGINAHAGAAAQHWSIRIANGSQYLLQQSILSNQTVIYRAVPASAP